LVLVVEYVSDLHLNLVSDVGYNVNLSGGKLKLSRD